MSSKRYRTKMIIISNFFSNEEQNKIAQLIDYNYKLPKNKCVECPQLDFKTLAGVLTFVLKKDQPIVIKEDPGTIYVQLSSKQPA